MSIIDTVDYIMLDVGYAERLVLNPDNYDSHNKINNHDIYQFNTLKCKENHNIARHDYQVDKIYGGYFCVDEENETCSCCYDNYDDATWESEEDHPQPSSYYPYMTVAIINFNEIYCEKLNEVDILINLFPKVLTSHSIIFKRIDGKPMKLSEYITIAKRINVLFCGCYVPTEPFRMEIHQNNNNKLLYCNYDTESG